MTSGNTPSGREALFDDLARMDEATLDLDSVADPAAAGAPIRRYAILERLGEGAMGVVYTAYDAHLERKIALKVLRREKSAAARAQFLGEARALARLSHPNVVTVHDAGEVGERPFLTMALVDGTSVRKWLAEAPRTWREIVAVFAAAGRGLAAAHAAGLVHRDVKPDNILVARDGSAMMADFGLARDAAAAGSEVSSAGTPRYMAPEQRQGQADVRSDQFAFCLALREALAGARPPVFVRRVVERGTREDAAARYPGMPALLADLGRDPARRRAIAAGALAVVAGGVALAFAGARLGAHAELCSGARHKLDGVWDADVAARIEAAFVATGHADAADTARRVARALDGYSDAWVAMHTDACRATTVRGEQSQALLDLRVACLDRRAAELRALTAALAAPGDHVDRAVQAVSALESLAACGDARALAQAYPLPTDPAARAHVEALQRDVEDARVMLRLGKYTAARAKLLATLAQARIAGYPPLLADTLVAFGNNQIQLDQESVEIEPALREAVLVAGRGRDASTEARALVQLVHALALHDHVREALELAVPAEAAVARSGDARARRQLPMALGATLRRAGRLDGAEDAMRRGLAQVLSEGESSAVNRAQVWNSLALILRDRGKLAEAASALVTARDIYVAELGPRHANVAGALLNLGTVHKWMDRYDESRRDFDEALAIQEASLGPVHSDIAKTLNNLAELEHIRNHLAEAEDFGRRALAMKESLAGPESVIVATSLISLAHTLHSAKREPEARPLLDRALGIRRRILGPKHADVAAALVDLASVDADLGDLAAAERELAEALAILAESHAPDRVDVFREVAVVQLALGRPREALAALDRAAAASSGSAVQTSDLAALRARAQAKLR